MIDGTHVAGSAAGSVFGVAKKASINMIKCMADDGSGSTADIISGINLAANNAVSSGRPSVVSMSLGGPANQAVDDAVSNAVKLGVPFIVAAGNEAADASTSSPARLGGPNGNPGIVTVGATTITDQMASFSNFGVNVDILAPGQDILSCGIDGDDAVKNDSGTSMSTYVICLIPHQTYPSTIHANILTKKTHENTPM
jgi:cerevisin